VQGTVGTNTPRAVASVVLGEIDMADNIFVDGWVLVTIVDDVSGDGTVDIYDLILVVSQ